MDKSSYRECQGEDIKVRVFWGWKLNKVRLEIYRKGFTKTIIQSICLSFTTRYSKVIIKLEEIENWKNATHYEIQYENI